MIFSAVIVLSTLFLFFDASISQNVAYEKRMLVPGRMYNTSLNYEQKLCIYCYRGVPKNLVHVWQTAYLQINLNRNEYDIFRGLSPQEVLEMYKEHKSSWTGQLLSWKSDKIDLDPFNSNCIGIDTSLDHRVIVDIIRIDLWRIVWLASGIFIFLAAPKLSSNPIFYYICGVTLGITTSILILLYFISKLIPRKPTMYVFVVGGWAVGVYLLQILWENMKIIATTYQSYVLIYTFITGVLSFVICYRFGPVTDPRSKNLIKWAMQAASLALIFFSSRCQEASTVVIVLLLLYYNFPRRLGSSFLSLWRQTFPKKVRLLTEDEYHEEGARETTRALEELREYCSSPKCNQWKTILSLQKPLRFAQFMEGSPHLEDAELLAYELETQKLMSATTEDSDSSEED